MYSHFSLNHFYNYFDIFCHVLSFWNIGSETIFLFKKKCLFVIFLGCVMKTWERKFAGVVSKYLLYFLALWKKSNYLIKKYLSISYFFWVKLPDTYKVFLISMFNFLFYFIHLLNMNAGLHRIFFLVQMH